MRIHELIGFGRTRRGFTLIELLVVVAMVAILLGAVTTSVSSAQARARIQKATSEVKVISQAILAYENWDTGNELDLMEDRDADSSSLGFLLGKVSAKSGGQVPALLMAQLRGGGKMMDPWGHPYRVTIRSGSIPSTKTLNFKTGFNLPNFYRVAPEERQ